MADTFKINAIRIQDTQSFLASKAFNNKAFALCNRNKETYENCITKYLQGWDFFNEAFEEQYKKDQNKYLTYKKMEDRQTWLKSRESNE